MRAVMINCKLILPGLKGKFYAKLAIKYLITSFYATVIGAECILNSPLNDIHKGKILGQPIKRCLNMVPVIKTLGRVSVAKKPCDTKVCYLQEPLTRHFQSLVSL